MKRHMLYIAAMLVFTARAHASDFSWNSCTLESFTNAVQLESCTHHVIDNGGEQIHMFMLDRCTVNMRADQDGRVSSVAILADYQDSRLNRWRDENFIRQTVAFFFPDWEISSAMNLYMETLPALVACASGQSITTYFGNRTITITPSSTTDAPAIVAITSRQ